MTFQHRAGVTPYTSACAFAGSCVFGKQSLGPIHCGFSFKKHPLSLSYGVILPSSLTTVLSLTLVYSTCLPVSVLVRAVSQLTLETFLETLHHLLRYFLTGSLPITPSLIVWRICLPHSYVAWTHSSIRALKLALSVIPSLVYGYRNINLLSIDYAFQPHLRSRLTQGGRAFPWNP